MSDRPRTPDPAPGLVAQGGVVATLLMFLVGSSVLAALGGAEADADAAAPLQHTERAMVAQAVASAAVLAFACVWPRGFALGLRGAGRSIVAGLALYAAFLCLWVPLSMVGVPALWDALDWPIEPQRHLEYLVVAPNDGATYVVLLATVCVVGPIAEEVVFRGYLQTGFAGLWGRRAGLWLTAVAFGLVHVGSGWYLFVPLTLLGWLFGVVRDRSGGLAAPIAVHAVHNALSVGVAVTFPDLFSWMYGR